MSLFLSWKRMDGIHDRAETMVLWAMVSIAFIGLFSAGCKKRSPAEVKAPLAEVITNRMNDAAYLDTLKNSRDVQMAKAAERNVIVAQMRAYSERVKATLPKDADEAALKAALAKDEGWRTLEARNAQAIEAGEQILGEARQKVRQRMLEESRAVQAVAEGKAKAVDPTAETAKKK